MNATKLPKSVQLIRASKPNRSGEYGWSVVPLGSDFACFRARFNGDAAMKACLTWLGNNGYKGDGEPINEIFTRQE